LEGTTAASRGLRRRSKAEKNETLKGRTLSLRLRNDPLRVEVSHFSEPSDPRLGFVLYDGKSFGHSVAKRMAEGA
jgi:hypothetical protein